MDALSDEEAGRLMKAVWRYTMTGERQRLSGLSSGMLTMILATLDQDAERDAALSEKRAAAGSEGGRKKQEQPDEAKDAKQMEANEANAGTAKQMQAKEANAYNKNQKQKQKQKQKQNQNQSQNQNQNRRDLDDDDDVGVDLSRAREDGAGEATDFQACFDGSSPHANEDGCGDSPAFMLDNRYRDRDERILPSEELYLGVRRHGDEEELFPEEIADAKCEKIVSAAIAGCMGRKATPAEAHLIAVKSRLLGVGPEMAVLAVRMAAENGARSLVSYVSQIFETWELEEVRTPEEALEYRIMYQESEECKNSALDDLDMFNRMNEARERRREAHSQPPEPEGTLRSSGPAGICAC